MFYNNLLTGHSNSSGCCFWCVCQWTKS